MLLLGDWGYGEFLFVLLFSLLISFSFFFCCLKLNSRNFHYTFYLLSLFLMSLLMPIIYSVVRMIWITRPLHITISISFLHFSFFRTNIITKILSKFLLSFSLDEQFMFCTIRTWTQFWITIIFCIVLLTSTDYIHLLIYTINNKICFYEDFNTLALAHPQYGRHCIHLGIFFSNGTVGLETTALYITGTPLTSLPIYLSVTTHTLIQSRPNFTKRFRQRWRNPGSKTTLPDDHARCIYYSCWISEGVSGGLQWHWHWSAVSRREIPGPKQTHTRTHANTKT